MIWFGQRAFTACFAPLSLFPCFLSVRTLSAFCPLSTDKASNITQIPGDMARGFGLGFRGYCCCEGAGDDKELVKQLAYFLDLSLGDLTARAAGSTNTSARILAWRKLLVDTSASANESCSLEHH